MPRLAVGLCHVRVDPLYFAQAVGRFVRARRRGEIASVFLPSVAPLLALASALELERDHALIGRYPTATGCRGGFAAAANRDQGGSDDLLGSFEALESEPAFDRVLYDGHEFGLGGDIGSQDELDFLGLPGLLDPDQVTAILAHKQATAARRRRGSLRGQPPMEDHHSEVAVHRRLTALRRELNVLVSAWARATGEPHGHVHAELRRLGGGAEVARASEAQIQRRIDVLRKRLAQPR